MPSSNWPVGLENVGTLLRTRTTDSQGNQLGTFTDDTRPTGAQVSQLITTATGDVASAVGSDLEEALWAQAATVVSYRAAMLVELTFFPEQVALGRSPYEQLRELYTDSLAALVAAAAGVAPGETATTSSPPSYAFPQASTLEVVLGPLPGGYVVPYGGTWYQ